MESNLQKIVQNKKGQVIGTKINTAILVIITVVILFSLFNALIPEAQSAGTTLGDIQTCGDAGGFFNSTQGLCLNGTGPVDTDLVSFSSIPLNTLFSSSGVIILLLMVGLLLVVLQIVFSRRK